MALHWLRLRPWVAAVYRPVARPRQETGLRQGGVSPDSTEGGNTMYRSVLALLFAAVLLLSGCAAGQQTVPKEKSEQ